MLTTAQTLKQACSEKARKGGKKRGTEEINDFRVPHSRRNVAPPASQQGNTNKRSKQRNNTKGSRSGSSVGASGLTAATAGAATTTMTTTTSIAEPVPLQV
mmetsp:Transcript_14262/g.19354  ORF Transcript_14262/g.19354 Transcript_14262/m.19354 type:complete len:101 (+) Transcript_14262:2559-2861(+)